jgi:hypothetical protein
MFSHRFHGFTQMVRLRSGLPQNSQKFIAEKELPQICRRVWHPCHTHAPCYSNVLPQISQIYTDIYSHRIHGIHRTDWQRIFSHRFHRFTQIFTPTEFTEYTEHFAYICVNP